MCAPAFILPLTPQPQLAGRRRVLAIIVPGLAVGLVAVTLFGAFHAVLIAPIWDRLAGGLPAAIAAGTAMAWAFDVVARARGSSSVSEGARFGGALFATLIPPALLDATARAMGTRSGDSLAGLVVTVALYMLSGGLVGWVLTKRRSEVFVVATLTLMVVSGGPLPIGRSVRAAALTVTIAVVCIACGGLTAIVRRLVQERS